MTLELVPLGLFGVCCAIYVYRFNRNQKNGKESKIINLLEKFEYQHFINNIKHTKKEDLESEKATNANKFMNAFLAFEKKKFGVDYLEENETDPRACNNPNHIYIHNKPVEDLYAYEAEYHEPSDRPKLEPINDYGPLYYDAKLKNLYNWAIANPFITKRK